MTPEIVKCLCELNSNNHLQPGESIEDWFKRLTNVACNIAQNHNTPPETLAILAKDSNYYIHYYVAKNPNTHPEILAILAKDSKWEVRYSVALNPNTSIETLAILVSDSNWKVRCCVAENPNISIETLAILAVDSDYYVSNEAQKQLRQRKV